MAIDSSTVKAGSFETSEVQGAKIPLTLSSFNAGTGVATYTFTRNFSFADNSTVNFASTGDTANQVADDSGNRLPANSTHSGGVLTIAIPIPSDVTPPNIVSMTVTPATITTSGSQTVTLAVELADAT